MISKGQCPPIVVTVTLPFAELPNLDLDGREFIQEDRTVREVPDDRDVFLSLRSIDNQSESRPCPVGASLIWWSGRLMSGRLASATKLEPVTIRLISVRATPGARSPERGWHRRKRLAGCRPVARGGAIIAPIQKLLKYHSTRHMPLNKFGISGSPSLAHQTERRRKDTRHTAGATQSRRQKSPGSAEIRQDLPELRWNYSIRRIRLYQVATMFRSIFE